MRRGALRRRRKTSFFLVTEGPRGGCGGGGEEEEVETMRSTSGQAASESEGGAEGAGDGGGAGGVARGGEGDDVGDALLGQRVHLHHPPLLVWGRDRWRSNLVGPTFFVFDSDDGILRPRLLPTACC
ncbi:hypothetical protein NL676_023196 [Syzygium grande]|nr:hypothetical protein NL676_023196 [Syzygium grande]